MLYRGLRMNKFLKGIIAASIAVAAALGFTGCNFTGEFNYD